MSIPNPPKEYSEIEWRKIMAAVEQELSKKYQKDSPLFAIDGPIVLASPDGNLWKLTVSNAGVVSSTLVTGTF